MTAVLVAIGVAVVTGAVIAVSAREARAAILGLVLALILAPLLGDGLPGVLPLAARLVAAVLAGYLLWIRARPASLRTRGSRIGWPAEAILALAAAIVGAALEVAPSADGSVGVAVASGGTALATTRGVALALAVLALSPLVTRPDALQVGIGAALAITAAELLHVGLAGSPAPLEHLAIAAATVAVAGATSTIARTVVEAHQSLDLRAAPGPRDVPDPRPTPAAPPARPGNAAEEGAAGAAR